MSWEAGFEREAFRILLVCTGNICRSPIAEQLLRGRLPLEDVRISSAGTAARHDDVMPALASATSIELGGSPRGHRARRLDVAAVQNSDLILVMTREHRSDVVRMSPRAHRKTFTMREFERLIPYAGRVPSTATASERLRTGVGSVAAARGTVPPPGPEDDDIPDPLGRSARVYRRVGSLIDVSTRSIANFLLAVTR